MKIEFDTSNEDLLKGLDALFKNRPLPVVFQVDERPHVMTGLDRDWRPDMEKRGMAAQFGKRICRVTLRIEPVD